VLHQEEKDTFCKTARLHWYLKAVASRDGHRIRHPAKDDRQRTCLTHCTVALSHLLRCRASWAAGRFGRQSIRQHVRRIFRPI